MDLAVVIPWRPTPDRLLAFQHVNGWFSHWFPDTPVTLADSGHDTFNRAASRNTGVRAAGADTVIVCDADTLPDPHGLHDAIRQATDGRLHFGYGRMAYLDEAQTAAELAGQRYEPPPGAVHNSSVMVIRSESWWRAGGQDERFTGWGGEDDAWFVACRTLLGEPAWHGGLAVSLWHDSERDLGSDRWRPNSDLAARYVASMGDPAAVQHLIEERTVTA